ncbi:alkaline phosphatase synthesis transcriptional regulatory protein PhoP [bacterium BMS3Bbin02]|nr:alkaline phosphatase synthesis transcriptional regulatory protein PhoP [bacterium BMS3Bbin02]
MRELRAAFREGLPPLIEALEGVADELRLGTTDVEDEARRLAHQLKGSGGSFGYPKVTNAAVEVLQASVSEMIEPLDVLVAMLRRVEAEDESAATQILVIDDDPLIQQLLVATLGSDSRDVVVAGSLKEAEKLFSGDFSLIILDLFLPDGDGREVIKQIRESVDTALTPILVLSGASTSHARDECLDLGAVAFVEKPFVPGDLFEIADQILHGVLPPQRTQDQFVEEEPGNPGPRAILLAEDDELTATLIKDRLLRNGFEVVHCANGYEALKVAETQPFVLAILDVKMPRMDGFELLAKLRNLPQLADMPIMMLTGMGSEHDVVRGFDLGADGYVLKPFSPAELVARIDRLLAQS